MVIDARASWNKTLAGCHNGSLNGPKQVQSTAALTQHTAYVPGFCPAMPAGEELAKIAFDPSASLKDLFGDCKGQELLEKIFNTYQAE